MPYIKPTKKPFEKMRRLLLGYELTASKLASILGCSLPTARQRLNNPGLITTEEWSKISRIGHVPIEEIREVFLQ